MTPRRDQLLLMLLFVAVWSSRLDAYIDPGSGNVAYQLLVSAAFGLVYFARKFVWSAVARISSLFGHSSTPTPPEGS